LKRRNPKFVIAGADVIAHVCLPKPLCLEKYNTNPRLGCFLLFHQGTIIGTGKVLSVHKPISPKEVRFFCSNWPNSFVYLDSPLIDALSCFFIMYISNHPVIKMVPMDLMCCIAQQIIPLYYFKCYKATNKLFENL